MMDRIDKEFAMGSTQKKIERPKRPTPPPGRKLTVKESTELLYKKFPKTMEKLSK